MPNDDRHVVVLGAGPAGLSAAHRFQREGYRVTVVERRDRVGGLGGTFQWNDFLLDYGPHAFHPRPSVVMDNIRELFKDDPDTLIHQSRNERLLLYDRLWNYPMQFWELLLHSNPLRTLRMGFAFLMTTFIYRYIAVPDDNFESWCIKRFGKPLYQLAFGNYTAKVWGIPPRKISPKFASQKIRGLNLKDLVKKILGSKGEETIDYWDDLFYPKLGSGQLYERYRAFLEEEGVSFALETEPVSFDTNADRVRSVTLRSPAGSQTLDVDLVVSTIPLTHLTLLLGDAMGEYVHYTASRLRFRSLILVFIEFMQENVSGRHWVYMLDKKYKSNRYTEQKNMSEHTCPKDRTVLCFEKSCDYNDATWQQSDDKLYRAVIEEDVEPNPLIDESNAGARYHVVRIRHGYPIYDLEFDSNLRVVLNGLSRLGNLYTTGRQGLFLQNGMHQSMVMGWEVGDYATGDPPSTPWAWYQSILARWDMD